MAVDENNELPMTMEVVEEAPCMNAEHPHEPCRKSGGLEFVLIYKVHIVKGNR